MTSETIHYIFFHSGLVMLLGLIMFISIFKSEIYHKARATSSSLEPLFTFHYGHSFILYVIGFVFVELAGILNVCLFNKIQKEVMNLNQVRILLEGRVKLIKKLFSLLVQFRTAY